MATVTLDRPEALNALSLPMIAGLSEHLAAWEADEAIRLILVRSAHPKAFCAGGDIRRLYQAARDGDHDFIDAFFLAEYRLMHQIGRLRTPCVALVDGICMGAGLGLAIHGRYRLAGPRARFAMPEIAIGLVPDVGASHFLSRLPGRAGLYLGLTGHRLSAEEALGLGIATHPATGSLEDRLRSAPADPEAFLASLDETAARTPAFVWSETMRAAVDAAFASDDPRDALRSLATATGDWAGAARDAMAGACPYSLHAAAGLLRRGGTLGLTECIAMELEAVRVLTRRPDFAEGVRAVVVDKDRKARWHPADHDEAAREWQRASTGIAERLPAAMAALTR